MSASLAPTWLSLVAETAGVAGACVTRIRLRATSARGVVRAVVQVQDRHGRVVGATDWIGDGIDLVCGAYVDLGCDFSALDELHIVAWLTSPQDQQPAVTAVAPAQRRIPFHPHLPTTLELQGFESQSAPASTPRKVIRHNTWAVPEAA